MAYYVGSDPQQYINAAGERYFYGLRRTTDGELFIGKVDQLDVNDQLSINNPGDPTENYNNFQQGVDFFEGRNVFHEVEFDNLQYEQYRWENRNIYYYINTDGELVLRVNQEYDYPTGVSSDG